MSSTTQVENWTELFVDLRTELSGCLAKLSALQSEVCLNAKLKDDPRSSESMVPCISIAPCEFGPAKSSAAPKKFLSAGKPRKKKNVLATDAGDGHMDSRLISEASGSTGHSPTNLRLSEEPSGATGHVTPDLIGRSQQILPKKQAKFQQTACGALEALSHLAFHHHHEFDSAKMSNDQILQILITGSVKQCESLIISKVDPNTTFGEADLTFIKLRECTPLALAVIRKQPRLVKFLIEQSAHPDSKYGFTSGALGMPWQGSCAQAAVAAGNLHGLQQLLNCRADLHSLSSNRASLLWHAAYFNQFPIVEYLIAKQSDVEERANSQDDAERSYTPLHAAAKGGHHAVSVALLEAKAQADVSDMILDESFDVAAEGKRLTRRRSALQDAIFGSHDAIVRELIENGDTSLCAQLPDSTEQEGDRALDSAFATGNTFLIAAIAKGLKHNPYLLDQLSRSDLVQFLSCAGDTPVLILRSIFQPCTMSYWTHGPVAGRNIRQHRNTAFLLTGTCHNVATGPHPAEFIRSWRNKEALRPSLDGFMNKLAPQERNMHAPMYVASVCFLACPIPEIHQHLDVLSAIADSKCDDLFKEATCQAIIKSAAEKVKGRAKIQFVISIAALLNLVIVNVLLNNSTYDGLYENAGFPLQCAISLGFAVCGMDLFLFILKALGFWCQEQLDRVKHEFIEVCSVSATLCVLVYVHHVGVKAKSTPMFCTALGAVVFMKWMLVLREACQFRLLGTNILPIMSTMMSIGPFVLVTSVCICASANLYYAFGLYNAFDSFFMIYRLAVLGDFNLDELENRYSTDMNVEAGGSVVMSNAAETDYYWVVRVMLLFLSFMMSISLMNLFIGVLTVSYEAHTQRAYESYLRLRTGTVLEARAVRVGWQTLTAFFHSLDSRRKNRSSVGFRKGASATKIGARRSEKIELATSLSHSSSTMSGSSVDKTADVFMWVCIDRQAC